MSSLPGSETTVVKDRARSSLLYREVIQDTHSAIAFGELSLPNRRLTSLEGLGSQATLRRLNLRRNYLSNFSFLSIQPNLKILDIRENEITSLVGLHVQPKLEWLGIAGNPICKHPMHRVMLLITIGRSLKKIDTLAITDKERQVASRFDRKAGTLLRQGWIIPLKKAEVPQTEESWRLLSESLANGTYSPPKPPSAAELDTAKAAVTEARRQQHQVSTAVIRAKVNERAREKRESEEAAIVEASKKTDKLLEEQIELKFALALLEEQLQLVTEANLRRRKLEIRYKTKLQDYMMDHMAMLESAQESESEGTQTYGGLGS